MECNVYSFACNKKLLEPKLFEMDRKNANESTNVLHETMTNLFQMCQLQGTFKINLGHIDYMKGYMDVQQLRMTSHGLMEQLSGNCMEQVLVDYNALLSDY